MSFWDKIEIERINLMDFIVVTALSIGFIYSIHLRMMELSMSIGSGLLGYIGGVTKNSTTTAETTTTNDISPDSSPGKPREKVQTHSQKVQLNCSGDCEEVPVKKGAEGNGRSPE